MKQTLSLFLCLILVFSLCACAEEAAPASTFTSTSSSSGSPQASPSADPVPSSSPEASSPQQGETDSLRHVEIDVADYGVISLALDPTAAPTTVENFLSLAQSGFYDGLTFHRIIEGFMIQGGDPLGNGFGGSDQTIPGEFLANGYQNDLSHVRGVISMARSTDPDSASSQFFIVHQDSTFLDGNYAAFGWVTDGMAVVDAICADAKPTDNNGSISPQDQPVITSITVLD